ncbi:glycoside hydrolase family protein [Nocardioides donggukensis]|uniref:Glycosyl hydrolase family 32 n=1 Tax=Nocardioides donggukensis TaxID=2774019 RepID=A0A927K742_9ACTN|nr:glycosyl hydrolase family 32 [Nocardioides donggukensis]MBD8870380.1 glycosyl hydrolase family 32 [Nocardioides donggukensis]
MFDLTDEWVWDFWVVDDRHTDADHPAYHLFFLKAPRSLGDPELRHLNASVGHAVSRDLRDWTRVEDALVPQPLGAFDDLATWTGSVVRDDDGGWHLFSTGVAQAEEGRVQRIGVSTSADLHRWERSGDLLLEADRRWYRRWAGQGHQEHWRDPWVVRDDAGLWHMYVTAQAAGGHPGGAGDGVVGHATSADLRSWRVGAPLSSPTGRFDQLEVISVTCVEGRWVLMFSCLGPEMPGVGVGGGGVWTVAVDGPGAPVDVAAAVRLTSERLYVGKLVPTGDGPPVFLAFENRGDSDAFIGGVIDPLAVRWRADGAGLELVDAPPDWHPEEAELISVSAR